METKIDEIVAKAIPLKDFKPSSCSIDRAMMERRRVELKKSIVSLLDGVNGDTHRGSGDTVKPA